MPPTAGRERTEAPSGKPRSSRPATAATTPAASRPTAPTARSPPTRAKRERGADDPPGPAASSRLARAPAALLFSRLTALPTTSAGQPTPIMTTVGCAEGGDDSRFHLARATESEARQEHMPAKPPADTPLGLRSIRPIGMLDDLGVPDASATRRGRRACSTRMRRRCRLAEPHRDHDSVRPLRVQNARQMPAMASGQMHSAHVAGARGCKSQKSRPNFPLTLDRQGSSTPIVKTGATPNRRRPVAFGSTECHAKRTACP